MNANDSRLIDMKRFFDDFIVCLINLEELRGKSLLDGSLFDNFLEKVDRIVGI